MSPDTAAFFFMVGVLAIIFGFQAWCIHYSPSARRREAARQEYEEVAWKVHGKEMHESIIKLMEQSGCSYHEAHRFFIMWRMPSTKMEIISENPDGTTTYKLTNDKLSPLSS